MKDERKSYEQRVASTSSDSRAGITRRDVLALLAVFGVPDVALAAAPSGPALASDPVVI